MTPQEFRQIRESLGLTYSELAEELGLGIATVWRREQPGARIRKTEEEVMRRLGEVVRRITSQKKRA